MDLKPLRAMGLYKNSSHSTVIELTKVVNTDLYINQHRIELSPGQTGSQVVASSPKLNLRRDLYWVAKQTGKFPRKYTKVTKNPFQDRCMLYFIGW